MSDYCTINGDARPLPQPLTLAELITEMGLSGRKIAVEQNGEIIPKSRHAKAVVSAGDTIEIVAAVGGG